MPARTVAALYRLDVCVIYLHRCAVVTSSLPALSWLWRFPISPLWLCPPPPPLPPFSTSESLFLTLILFALHPLSEGSSNRRRLRWGLSWELQHSWEGVGRDSLTSDGWELVPGGWMVVLLKFTLLRTIWRMLRGKRFVVLSLSCVFRLTEECFQDKAGIWAWGTARGKLSLLMIPSIEPII